jgi:Protein of unknown function (DUF1453)
VMTLRWRRMRQVRPLKIEHLWIVPALYAVAVVATFAAVPPHGIAWLFCLFALGLGAALGWQRGRMMRLSVDPATQALNQTGSPAAMLFLLALVAVRSGARSVAGMGGGAIGLDPMAVTDMLMMLALGLFTAQRIEMYLRGRRLLAEARAAAA